MMDVNNELWSKLVVVDGFNMVFSWFIVCWKSEICLFMDSWLICIVIVLGVINLLFLWYERSNVYVVIYMFINWFNKLSEIYCEIILELEKKGWEFYIISVSFIENVFSIWFII